MEREEAKIVLPGETDAPPVDGPSPFTHQISFHERQVLRDVVRRVHFSKTKRRLATPTAEIDKFIDQMGPEIMDNLLRAAQVARLPQSTNRRHYSIPGVTPRGNLRRKPTIERMVRRFLLKLQDTVPGDKD